MLNFRDSLTFCTSRFESRIVVKNFTSCYVDDNYSCDVYDYEKNKKKLVCTVFLLPNSRVVNFFAQVNGMSEYSKENKDYHPNNVANNNNNNQEYILDDDECPLAILMNHQSSQGKIF